MMADGSSLSSPQTRTDKLQTISNNVTRVHFYFWYDKFIRFSFTNWWIDENAIDASIYRSKERTQIDWNQQERCAETIETLTSHTHTHTRTLQSQHFSTYTYKRPEDLVSHIRKENGWQYSGCSISNKTDIRRAMQTECTDNAQVHSIYQQSVFYKCIRCKISYICIIFRRIPFWHSRFCGKRIKKWENISSDDCRTVCNTQHGHQQYAAIFCFD